MPSAGENPHRWKRWLNSQQLRILEDFVDRLRFAWIVDRNDPRSYPVNTDYAIWETRLELRDPPFEEKATTKLPRYNRPKSVHDFINEGVLARLYEQRHSESYRDALRCASDGFGKGFRAWKKIVDCLPAVYLLGVAGEQALPKPRVNFLHRELLGIAKSLELDQLIQEGLAEFFNDICPCGKQHKAEAIRKLNKRISTRIR